MWGQLTVTIGGAGPTCGGDNDGILVANASGGVTPYFYLWNTGEVGPVLLGVGPGFYSVTVTDNAGNTASASMNYTEPPPLLIEVEATPDCAGSGDLQVSASGGVPPYFYQWSNGATTGQQQDLPAGDYCVSVMDANACLKVVCTTIADSISVMVDATEVTCNDACDASVTAYPSGGTEPYTYLWSTNDSTQTITNKHIATYTVTVTDANGCTGVGVGNVTGPDALELSFDVDTLPCGTGLTATATANVTGGTPPYGIGWSNGDIGPVATGLEPGQTYHVFIADANNCYITDSITIVQETELDLQVFTTDEICGSPQGGLATVMVQSGEPPYSFLWSNGGTTQTILDLPSGIYTVTVTDNSGCSGVAQGVVGLSSANIELTFETEDESGCGAADGSATVFASGGNAPYTYLWDNGATTQTISGLTAGMYFVTVIDASACPALGVVMVMGSNELLLELTATGECTGDASAEVNVLNGTAPYVYSWNTGDSTASITGLTAGTYTVSVVDANGCEGVDSISVDPLPGPELSLSVGPISCFGNSDGSVTSSVTGGVPPYEYLWNTGDATPDLEDLGPGAYVLTVTDVNGCTAVDSVELLEPALLELDLTAEDLSCAGADDGSATAIISGGASPVQLLWSTGDTTATATGLAPGTYFVTATDANGCTAVDSAVVAQPDPIVLSFQANPVSCSGVDDGAVSVVAEGGMPPYEYLWNTGDTSPDLTGLPAGSYEVTVTDAAGCTATGSVEVTAPDVIDLQLSSTPVSCPGGSDGAVSVMASGGMSPYGYLWDTGDTSPDVTGLPAGLYSVTVTDANGCTAVGEATVDEPDPLGVFDIALDAPCEGDSTGIIEIGVTGGTPPYAVLWSTGDTTLSLTGIPAGSYSVAITDANGCTAEETFDLPAAEGPSLSVDIVSASCFGGDNGAVSVSASGGSPPYVFEWSNGETGMDLIGLAPGDYAVTVSDGGNCTDEAMVTIEEDLPGACNAYVLQPISMFGGADGAVAVDPPAGGTPPYTYLWSNGVSDPVNTGLAAGTYTVTVSDAEGCQSICEVVLENPSKIGDFVWDDLNQNGVQDPNEPGVGGIKVTLTGTDEDGNSVNQMTTTGANGLYLFDGLAPGMYQLTFSNLPIDYQFTLLNVGDDDEDSDVNANGITATFTVNAGVCDLDYDAGIYTFCINVDDPGEIAGNEYLCGPGNDPGPIVEVAPPSGGQGALEFLWMKSTQSGPFNPNTWMPIPNSNSPNYDPGPIFQTTYYARCVRREGCTLYLETSNVVVKEVGDDAIAGISGPATVCVGDVVTYVADNAGPGAIYSWNFGPNANPQTASTPTVNVTFSQFGVYTVTLTVVNNDCTAYAYLPIYVTSSPTVCGPFQAPVSIGITAYSIPGGAVQIDWQTDRGAPDHTFCVEVATDGHTFRRLSEQRGDGRHFSFVDESPSPGNNYYRIAAIDPAGEVRLTDPVQVGLFPGRPALVYPNPVVDQLRVDWKAELGDEVVLALYHISGKLVRTVAVEAKQIGHTFDLSDLPAGSYLLQVQYGAEGRLTYPILKQ